MAVLTTSAAARTAPRHGSGLRLARRPVSRARVQALRAARSSVTSDALYPIAGTVLTFLAGALFLL